MKTRTERNKKIHKESKLVKDIFEALKAKDKITVETKGGEQLEINAIGYQSYFKDINDNKIMSVWYNGYDDYNITPINQVEKIIV